MNKSITLSPKQKALQINLDDTIYGSFVEIGGGQEVARQFFEAGSASGTIAKTMSAYDKDFSNAIYAKEKDGRFVSKSRLINMLTKEYSLLEERLDRKNFKKTRFFAFADTVETISYNKTNKGHGWLGLRFQLNPNSKPNDMIIHVRLHDQDSRTQRETLGVLGTNLIHACFFTKKPKDILKNLYDSLTRDKSEIDMDKIEIDMVEIVGPDFKDVDNRLLSLTLVKERMTNAVIFGPDGMNRQPSDILWKKHILTMRGSFRPVTKVNVDMLDNGFYKYSNNKKVEADNIQILFEITLSNLRKEKNSLDSSVKKKRINQQDFLDRADLLCSLGYTVMISNYMKYYKLIEYLSQFTNKRMGLILGVDNLKPMFEEKYYRNLNGGIMEAFGIILKRDIKMYLYPYQPKKNIEIQNSKNIKVHPRGKRIYQYLLENKRIEDLDFNPDILDIFSRNVLKLIKSCKDGSWEKKVPKGVAKIIKEKDLFGRVCKLD